MQLEESESAGKTIGRSSLKDVRRGICALLKNHEPWEVCGEARDGHEAVEKALQLKPDVVILDIGMPLLNGLETTRQMLQHDPDFRPPTREARAFHELTGEMWIDARQRRLVGMRGQLMADVKFAGGLLGYLLKGGHFDVEQQELSPERWELTSLYVDMQGKALLFKTIAVQQKERRTNFRTVPAGLPLAHAAEMLTKQVILAAND